MSEGFVVDGINGKTAGIVVRQAGERGFRFHSSHKRFDAMDGQVFVSPVAAQRAVIAFEKLKRRQSHGSVAA
jgi:hypothetical protein